MGWETQMSQRLNMEKCYCYMLLFMCAVCGSKKAKFIKEQEASGLLSQLGIRNPLNKIPLLEISCFKCIKMNNIINKFLSVGDKFMSEMHLRQPGFTYSTC